MDSVLDVEPGQTSGADSGIPNENLDLEAGQTSGADSDTLNALHNSMSQAYENATNESQTVTPPKIQKVTSVLAVLRSNFLEDYLPKMASLGPIHNRDSKYQKLTEDYKQKLTEDYKQKLDQSGEDCKQKLTEYQSGEDCKQKLTEYQSGEDCKQKLTEYQSGEDCKQKLTEYQSGEDCKQKLTEYQSGEDYKQKLTNDFVQASSQALPILEQRIENIQKLGDYFNEEVIGSLTNKQLASMLCADGCAILQYIYCQPTHRAYEVFARDILLLENQIPYKVLKELMRLSKNKDELEKSIVNFIEKHANLPSQANPQRDVQIDGDHVHLLDLLRTSLLGNSQAKTSNSSKDLISNRNVRELKAAGIYLRRSTDWVWRKIAFIRQFYLLGRLNLPPIIVDNSTRVKVLNLVAYEMCPDFTNDSGVISYLFFLSSLIREAQDVKELRDAGVLDSIRSDTDLQNLFSEICVELGSDPDNYIGVKEKIEEYYGTLMSWMLQSYHAYIKNSSWPLGSFLVLLLGLFLSSTQTWFKVNPASQSHS